MANWNDPHVSVSAPQMRREIELARAVHARAEAQGWDRIPPEELMTLTVAIMERCLMMMEGCYAIAEIAEQIGMIGDNVQIDHHDFQLALASQGFLTRIVAGVIAAAVRGGIIQTHADKVKLTSEEFLRLIAEMGEQLAAHQPPPRTIH
jgi:hypothetical protein